MMFSFKWRGGVRTRSFQVPSRSFHRVDQHGYLLPQPEFADRPATTLPTGHLQERLSQTLVERFLNGSKRAMRSAQ
jgi:hypothetical protein